MIKNFITDLFCVYRHSQKIGWAARFQRLISNELEQSQNYVIFKDINMSKFDLIVKDFVEDFFHTFPRFYFEW